MPPLQRERLHSRHHYPGGGGGHVSGGSSYVGPLDIMPGAVVAYSQRAMSAALRGSALYTIRRSGDDAIQSFSSDVTTGVAPNADIAAFVAGGAGSGFLYLWNDQSGNGLDLTQTNGAKQLSWAASGLNGRSVLNGVNSGALARDSGFSFSSGGFTIFIVAKQLVHFSAGLTPYVLSYVDFYTGQGATVDLYDGTNEASRQYNNAIDNSTFHLWEAAWQYGAGSYKVDGVDLTETASFDSGGPLGPITVGDILLNVEANTEAVAEIFAVASDDVSAGDMTRIRQNITDYYGPLG